MRDPTTFHHERFRLVARWCGFAAYLAMWALSFSLFCLGTTEGFGECATATFTALSSGRQQHRHHGYAGSSISSSNNGLFIQIDDNNNNDPPTNTENDITDKNTNNLRLNKVFRETHSRRSADALIAQGRVKINGAVVVDMGRRVRPYRDIVELDHELYAGWEQRHGIRRLFLAEEEYNTSETRMAAKPKTTLIDNDVAAPHEEVYIKFWKPVGVTSTTDLGVPGNLLEALSVSRRGEQDRTPPPRRPTRKNAPITQRIFSVGRLDKDSSGLLLLTSDGRLPNSVLRKEFKRPKVYHVTLDKPIASRHIQQLRDGLVIATDTVRQKSRHVTLTAQTLPCLVERVVDDDSNIENCRRLKITLTEGRNRQIRVMLQTVGGYIVTQLHRTAFLGIDLSGLDGPGDWTRLDATEMALLQQAMAQAAAREQQQKQEQQQEQD